MPMPMPKHAVQKRQTENKKNLMSQVIQPKSTCVGFLVFLVSKSQLRCVSSSSSSLRLDGGPSLMISTSDADVEFRLKMLSSEAAPASTSSATGQRLLYMFSSLIWTNVPSVSYNENLSPFSPLRIQFISQYTIHAICLYYDATKLWSLSVFSSWKPWTTQHVN
jgi:hypothetical protein